MKLIKETKIRLKYMNGFDRQTKDVSEIVIHGTGGGQSAQAIIDWMLGGERKDLYNAGIGLFHYLIDFNGDVHEIINPDKWVYHSEAGNHDKNTIGIELMNPIAGNGGGYRLEQYTALKELIIDLLHQYSEINSIVSHDANRNKYSNLKPKPCPGGLFDWTQIEEVATNSGKKITIERG